MSPTAIWGELICVKKLITVLSLVLFLQIAHPTESENKTATGLTRIQFVTDVNQVVPGEEITTPPLPQRFAGEIVAPVVEVCLDKERTIRYRYGGFHS